MSKFFDTNYTNYIKSIASLSGLFSENEMPYLYYRIMEKIFCKAFKAADLSRSDTAYDAKIGELGIGLKTFIMHTQSVEKVAEFNALSSQIKAIKDKNDLAYEISKFRNERIELANRTYGINLGLYHIIARDKNKFYFFETDYDKIRLDNLQNISNNDKSLKFNDGINDYIFNHSKSVLQRRFLLPKNANSIDIDILSDPFEKLLEMGQIFYLQKRAKQVWNL